MTALLTGILAVIATALDYSGTSPSPTCSGRPARSRSSSRRAARRAPGRLLRGRLRRWTDVALRRRPPGRGGLVLGLAVTIVAAALGWVAGDQYNLLDRSTSPHPDPHRRRHPRRIVTGDRRPGRARVAAMLGGPVLPRPAQGEVVVTAAARLHRRLPGARGAADPVGLQPRAALVLLLRGLRRTVPQTWHGEVVLAGQVLHRTGRSTPTTSPAGRPSGPSWSGW